MIDLIPAIDIINGECVRLTKGDYSQKKVYNANPVAIAQEFASMGFKRLHMVDLDGAKSKHVVNADVLRAVSQATSLSIDFGGGIKTQEDMDKVFDNGAKMATVGSISYTDPQTFEARQEYCHQRMDRQYQLRRVRIYCPLSQEGHQQGALHRHSQGRSLGRHVNRAVQATDGTIPRPVSDSKRRRIVGRRHIESGPGRNTRRGVWQGLLRGPYRY